MSKTKEPVTLESLAGKFEIFDQKIGNLDKKLDQKFTQLDQKIESKFNHLDGNIEDLTGKTNKAFTELTKDMFAMEERLSAQIRSVQTVRNLLDE